MFQGIFQWIKVGCSKCHLKEKSPAVTERWVLKPRKRAATVTPAWLYSKAYSMQSFLFFFPGNSADSLDHHAVDISNWFLILKQALWNMHWGRANFSTQFVSLHWAWFLAPFFLESSVFIIVIMQHSTHIYFPIPQTKKLCKLKSYVSPTFVGSYAVLCLVTQSCLTLCDPMDCSLPGSSVHGILQIRILEWVAFSFSRGSSQPRDQTQVSCIAGRLFTIWATREAQEYWSG